MESSFGPNFISSFMSEFEPSEVMDMLLFLVDEDPKTFEETMSSMDASFWREVVNIELDSIMTNDNWDL